MTDASKPVEDTLTNDILLDDFRRSLKAANRSDATLRHYLGAASQFISFCDKPIEDVTRSDIEDWLIALRATYREASVLNRYKGLAAFFRWLVEEDEIAKNPMARVKPPAVSETSKDVIDPADLSRMFAWLEKQKRWRDAAIIAILYDTGMRAGELASVRLADMDRDSGLILLRAENTKGRRERVVRVSPAGLRYVDRYLRRRKKDSPWLITGTKGRMTANGIYQVVRERFEEFGLDARIGPHDLRHSSATHVVGEMSEGDMMTLFGWNSSKMARHYARQRLTDAALKAHEKSSPMERLGR